jgi:sn-glycerol 3-phosphate transport system permease protein
MQYSPSLPPSTKAQKAIKPPFRRRSEAGAGGEAMFPHKLLPYLLLLPQLLVVAVFFLWPGIKALVESLYEVNVFGLGGHFAGLANFRAVFASGTYGESLGVTLIYAGITTVLAMGIGLFLAVQVDRVRRGRSFYRTVFAWTYAVPAAISGALWLFIFNPEIGVGSVLLGKLHIPWNFNINLFDAMALIIAATVWQQSAYNFLFFTAGLQAIPAEVLEAASLDGAGSMKRFWRVVFPLLSPTTFYLSVMNIIYVFFSTFSIIDIITQGGPHDGTETLVYQIYQNAFQNANTSAAAAETVLLIILVSILTVVQFRYINRRVHYQ